MSVVTKRSTVYLMHIGTFMYIAGVIKCRRVDKPALDMAAGCELVSASTAQSSGMTLQRVFIQKQWTSNRIDFICNDRVK